MRYKNVSLKKETGATYTPEELADFVAKRICHHFNFSSRKKIKILDPSVGDGALSIAILNEIRKHYSGQLELYAFDTDREALEAARSRLENHTRNCRIHYINEDFLQHVSDEAHIDTYDVIIANPPYVRTQIIGSQKAQTLSKDFGLSGRIDLYQLFIIALSRVLSKDGALGIITSNRFMTTKSGSALRAKMTELLNLKEIYDLGDTKLFKAAVLPAVMIANGMDDENRHDEIEFTSIYETSDSATFKAKTAIESLKNDGVTLLDDGRKFHVKKGTLNQVDDAIWRVSVSSDDHWLAAVKAHTSLTFSSIGNIRVGVKTCADKVFIKHDWNKVTDGKFPELLKPLITHHDAGHYRAVEPKLCRQILYPHYAVDGKRMVYDLDDFPDSKDYLESHKETLQKRTYLTKSGREWYELWVPQNPESWSKPKLVFRDISKRPTFWIDLDGGVVNGDCYWMVTNDDRDVSLLWLAVAVANSSFIEEFYDRCFNNKLYGGRRRFITQYVEEFPLPNPESDLSKEIIKKAKLIYEANHIGTETMMAEIDKMVWKAFGF